MNGNPQIDSQALRKSLQNQPNSKLKSKLLMSFAVRKQLETTRQVSMRAMWSLCLLLILTIISQVVVQNALNLQSSSSNTFSIIGRERLLLLQLKLDSTQYAQTLTPQTRAVLETDWTGFQFVLASVSHGDPQEHISPVMNASVLAIFRTLEPDLQLMTQHITALFQHPTRQNALVLAQQVGRETDTYFTALNQIGLSLAMQSGIYFAMIQFYEILFGILYFVLLLIIGLFVLWPAFRRLRANVYEIQQYEENGQRKKDELEQANGELLKILEEVRRASHGTRSPVRQLSAVSYAVQSGSKGSYTVTFDKNGIGRCPCSIFAHNAFCYHVQLAKTTRDRQQAQLHQHMQQIEHSPTQTLQSTKRIILKRPPN